MAQLNKTDDVPKGKKSKTNEGVTCIKLDPSCKSVSSFADLDEVLKEYGMRERDRTRFMRATHQKVTSNIITSIKEASKNQSKYKLMSRMCEIQSNDDCRNVEAADFTNKLDLNYDQWIANKESNEEQFKKELADILQVDAFTIQIKDTKKGSVVIEWVYQIVFRVHDFVHQCPRVPIDYDMKPDDQIEVKWRNTWYPTTVVRVQYDHTQPGKSFEVRYNPLHGTNRFWNNSETFNTVKQVTRLKLPNRGYFVINGNIVQRRIEWTPPPLCAVSNANNANGLAVGDHVFVKPRNGRVWYRCEVIEISINHQGKSIKVIYLIKNNTTWLKLFERANVARISLHDPRP
eukprot:453331_1